MNNIFAKPRKLNARKIQAAARAQIRWNKTTGAKKRKRYAKELKKLSKLGGKRK